MGETSTLRRADRWREARRIRGNPWAVASLGFALLGLGALGLIVAGTAGASPFDSLPDPAGPVLYGAVPSFGLLSLFTGLVGRLRWRMAWMAWTGVVVGSALVLLSLMVLVILLNALRALG